MPNAIFIFSICFIQIFSNVYPLHVLYVGVEDNCSQLIFFLFSDVSRKIRPENRKTNNKKISLTNGRGNLQPHTCNGRVEKTIGNKITNKIVVRNSVLRPSDRPIIPNPSSPPTITTRTPNSPPSQLWVGIISIPKMGSLIMETSWFKAPLTTSRATAWAANLETWNSRKTWTSSQK